jgi:adenylate cyclase
VWDHGLGYPLTYRPVSDWIPTGIRVTDTSHTFLFADLVGFTALAELEGDTRALAVALELQRRTAGLLSSHGAEQVKAIGDGLMLRCTRPAAAVALGLQVVEIMDEPGLPSVRVGIHTGPALRSDDDWYGQTVNVAARLCAVAPPGQVLISEATRVAAGPIRRVDFGERELHWLRNVAEPIGTHLARPRPDIRAGIGRLLGHAFRWRARASEAVA